MATLLELRQFFGNGKLQNKIEAACILAARTIQLEAVDTPNHANRLLWAKNVRDNPGSMRSTMLMVLLAEHNETPAATIEVMAEDETGTYDDQIVSLVASAIDSIADGS